ncbi:MBL fold metallo-hydrolase [Bacteroidota bacterium]
MKRNLLVFFIINTIITLNLKSQDIELHYLGHSAFVIQFNEITVVTDYGKPNAWKQWGWDSPIHDIGNLVPDIMTYSHLHEDHYDSTRIPKGVKHILKNGKELDYKGLKITTIPTCEDKFGDFGNMSYLFSYKGYNILHTGDIQTMIANIENDAIAKYFKDKYPENIDLLIMPIEGKIKYIPKTQIFIQLLNPKSVIPSHHWSQEYLDEFISYLKEKGDKDYNIQIRNEPAFSFTSNNQDDKTLVIVLERSNY